MATRNLTGGGSHDGTIEELVCSPSVTTDILQELVYLSPVNILLALTAFLGNALILVALHKESSLHAPSKLLYRCLATTDLCVGLLAQPLLANYWMTIIHKDWSLCRYAFEAMFISASALGTVSLLTLTAISVDRLLALLLQLRYRQVVTLRRTHIIVVIFWVVCVVAALCYILNPLITFWCCYVIMPSCLVISIVAYTKIFHALGRHQTQVQHHDPRPRSQPNALNMARYRKAVYSALCVQLALVACYLPYAVVSVMVTQSGSNSSHLLAWPITALLVAFNSTLNPFLYCWKITEVRQAVKQTIRQVLSCPWT